MQTMPGIDRSQIMNMNTTQLDLSGPKIRSIGLAIDLKSIVESTEYRIATTIIRRISFSPNNTVFKHARETIRKAKTGNHDRPVLTLSDRHIVNITSAHLL